MECVYLYCMSRFVLLKCAFWRVMKSKIKYIIVALIILLYDITHNPRGLLICNPIPGTSLYFIFSILACSDEIKLSIYKNASKVAAKASSKNHNNMQNNI